MILMQGIGLTKSFSHQPILDNVNLTIQTGQRVGLVGANGVGKSTLLKIIAGQLAPDNGSISRPKNITWGYLAQKSTLDSKRSVLDEMRHVFIDLINQEEQIRQLEIQMGSTEATSDPRLLKQITEQYTSLQEDFHLKGGYNYETTMYMVLQGLNFDEQYHHLPIYQLSGGEKTRLALAKLLLTEPDLLLLDEPTNYLDLATLDWLEKHLQSYTGAILIVSHDRYFLNNTVTMIYELEAARLQFYQGNYTDYVQQKAARLASLTKQYRHQQQFINRQREFINRNKSRASTAGRAQSRIKLLEKIKPIAPPSAGHKKMKLAMGTTRTSGQQVLAVENLSVGYQNTTICRGITFTIQRHEKVAVVGPNGTGKSTLLKTLAGLLPAPQGEIKYGHHVTFSFFEQEQQHLDDSKTLLRELWDAYPNFDEHQVRTALGNFLFSGEDVEKKVGELSGGEKSRLALAKTICSQANFLLLDEPTSHLDIGGHEALEQALSNYSGTILFVSHDRYFINQVATKVMELTPRGVHMYFGDYDYYLSKKEPLPENKPSAQPDLLTDSKKEYLERKKIQRDSKRKERRQKELEEAIEVCEKNIKLLEQQLYQPEVYNDHVTYRQKNADLRQLQAQLNGLMTDWLQLVEDEANQ